MPTRLKDGPPHDCPSHSCDRGTGHFNTPRGSLGALGHLCRVPPHGESLVEVPMICPGCGEDMLPESFSGSTLCECLFFDGWRCVACGEILGPGFAKDEQPSLADRSRPD
jgi:hypothetical protein